MSSLPLEGLRVLDFSQFLAGPAASLRLADLGADVIKIERPGTGDLTRQLYISNLEMDGDSTLFHTINRNKQSFAANLKDTVDLERVRALIRGADVMIQNFRPGVIDRLGLGVEATRDLNPKLIYASVSGYGQEGPLRSKPGQDLLAQSVSGLTWLTGNRDDPPLPFGLAVADLFAGAHLAQGILACLVRRSITGEGGLVEVSLLESVLDMQFEVFTTYLNDGGKLPDRGLREAAHAFLAAPYGIYRTVDGYLALSMTPVPRLGELLELPELVEMTDPQQWFEQRDEIVERLSSRLAQQTVREWLDLLEPADIWAIEVLNWSQLEQSEAFDALDMIQEVPLKTGTIRTTRCPIRIDGHVLKSRLPSPGVGQHTEAIIDGLKTVDQKSTGNVADE